MNIYVFYLKIAPHPLDTKHQVTGSRGSDNTDSSTDSSSELTISSIQHLDLDWQITSSPENKKINWTPTSGSPWQRGSWLFTTQHFSHHWDSSLILTREESVQQITSSPAPECKTQLITDCRLSHEKRRHMQHWEINPESRTHPSLRLEYPGLRSQGYCYCSSLGSFLCPFSIGIKWITIVEK